jgi:hypothetical protein
MVYHPVILLDPSTAKLGCVSFLSSVDADVSTKNQQDAKIVEEKRPSHCVGIRKLASYPKVRPEF